MLKRGLVALGLWIARLGGWSETPMLPEPIMAKARQVVAEVERQALKNGQQRRHNALRAMLNHFPTAERDCGLAIELAVRRWRE